MHNPGMQALLCWVLYYNRFAVINSMPAAWGGIVSGVSCRRPPEVIIK
jgi:hypothetical protein